MLQSFWKTKKIKSKGGPVQLLLAKKEKETFGPVVPCAGTSACLSGNIHTLLALFDFVFAQSI